MTAPSSSVLTAILLAISGSTQAQTDGTRALERTVRTGIGGLTFENGDTSDETVTRLYGVDDRASLLRNDGELVPNRFRFSLGASQDEQPEGDSAPSSSSEDLAKKLANPVASLISVPMQFNYDQNIGPADDGGRLVLNVQPVIPFALSENWNLISRTIVPLIHQDDIFPDAGDQTGMGDIVQSLFFSPKKPTDSGWILGAGPVMLLPSATDDLLGGEKWGAGPTIIGLRQQGHWTYGLLANHIWSFAGDDDREDVNATLLQPFLAYTTADAWTFSGNLESTYNWEASEWAVPVNGGVSKLVRVGDQNVSFSAGVRYWAESSTAGPEGFGFRLGVTLLFPR